MKQTNTSNNGEHEISLCPKCKFPVSFFIQSHQGVVFWRCNNCSNTNTSNKTPTHLDAYNDGYAKAISDVEKIVDEIKGGKVICVGIGEVDKLISAFELKQEIAKLEKR